MKAIVIIPARGGSERIKDKNISDLNGTPLIAWTIINAIGNDLVDDVIVSTNDVKISKVAEEYGALVVNRPDALCTKTSKSEDAIKHVLDKTGYVPEYIVMMQCTQPFRQWKVIDKAIEKIDKKKYNSLFFTYPIERWIWHPLQNYPMNYDLDNRIMTQDKDWEVIECSDYIFRHDFFMQHHCRLGGIIARYMVHPVYGIDIDTPYDLRIANAIAKEFNWNAENQSIQKTIR